MSRRSLKNVCRLRDGANLKLEPEDDFLEDLKRSIELTEVANQHKPSQTYKPSSMKCVRNMYYQVVGADADESDLKYSNIGILNSGSDIHIRIQQAIEGMKDNGIDCEYVDVADYVKSRNLDYLTIREKSGMETKLYHNLLNMSFMTDGIIRYKGRYYILEIKTENNYKWTMRKGVAPEHYAQGTAYSISFNLDEVIFVYVNRDNLEMKSYMLNVTDDMKQELVAKIDESDKYLKLKKTPPKPIDLPKNACTYCGYRKLCEKDG
jgi:CRISPR/Cas system-associated exonuclease Cas4 (RecB family)